MPNIREASAPGELALRPDDRAMESTASAGRRISGYYNQMGEAKNAEARAIGDTGKSITGGLADVGSVAVKYNDQRERGNISTAATGGLAELDKDWTLTVNGNGLDPKDPNYVPPADPRDASVAGRFMEEKVEPKLEKLRGIAFGEAGQAFADSKIDQIRNHLTQKLSADMSSRAGQAALLNDRQTTNNLSNLVTTSPDIASVKMALQMHNEAADSWRANPNLSVAQRGALDMHFQQSQEQIVHAAAFAAIGKASDPQAAAAQFSTEFPQYIKGDAVNQLAKAATVVQHASRSDQERAIRLQKQQQQDRSDQREVAYLQKVYSDDPKEKASVTARQIVLDREMTREGKERLVGIVNRELKPETDARISAQTSVQIMRLMQDPNFEPEKVRNAILEARTKDPGTPGSLTKADVVDLQKQVDDIKTPQGAALAADRHEFFKQYGPTIDPEMKIGNPTPLGAQGIYRAEKDARRQERVLRTKGLDPHLLYDPSSEYFLGRPARIGSYRPSLADKAAYAAQLKADEKRPAKSVNLTADGSEVTGIQTLEIPAGMSPADAMKWARGKGAKEVLLPDGRIGTVK